MAKIQLWDVPTRLFHWPLIPLMGGLWWTGEQGADWMPLHAKLGYTLLGFLIFRIIWGFWGSQTARFAFFLASPRRVLAYLKKPDHFSYLGHNPLGGWSVMGLLTLMSIQVITGLFTNDDIAFEAPLVKLISKEVSDFLTGIHKAHFNILLGMIFLHISAIVVYQVVKKQHLVQPMVTGYVESEMAIQPKIASLLRFMVCVMVAAASVIFLVNFF